MTPPPITIISLGIFERDKAPVEEIITFSSKGRPGKGMGSLPVAKMMFLALTYFYPPPFKSTLISV